VCGLRIAEYCGLQIKGVDMANVLRKRQFFAYMEEHGVGYQRAANALGLSVNTARSWAYRARKEGTLQPLPRGGHLDTASTAKVAPPSPSPEVAPAPSVGASYVPTVADLRDELQGALYGLEQCERAESWHAGVAYRKLVRTLRKELKDAIQEEEHKAIASGGEAAGEIIRWLRGDPATRTAVFAAFGVSR